MLIDTLLLVRDAGRLALDGAMTLLVARVDSFLTRCIGRSDTTHSRGVIGLVGHKLLLLGDSLWRKATWRWAEEWHPSMRQDADCGCGEVDG